MKTAGLLMVFLLFSCPATFSQERDTTDIMMGIIKEGDTIIHKNLQEIWVLPEKQFKNRWRERRYYRYVEKVKKVYPFAKLAGDILREYEPQYYALETDKERRELMKNLEKRLLAEYKEELKGWSISEGKILLKLIDRETDRTSFILLKDFRGGFSAFFWQGIARLFGSDLKEEYDPEGDDQALERIVSLIEVGYL